MKISESLDLTEEMETREAMHRPTGSMEISESTEPFIGQVEASEVVSHSLGK